MSESAEKNADKDRQRVDAYKRELAQDPSSLAFIPLAETLNRLAEWDEAARVARRGLEAHPGSVTGLLTLAVAEAGRDNIKDALELIKNALVIDQENPRALALMGSLLLQKGLAKRAVQFLNQAVKLDPESREYVDLLKRAKRLAKLDNPVPLPVVRGENVPAVESPWNEGDEGAEPTEFAPDGGSEHTVFAPDGGRKLAPPKKAPARSPFSVFDEDDEEVTRHHPKDAGPPRRVTRAMPASPHEEGTAFDVRKLVAPSKVSAAPELPGGKKPKVGGSAADYSRILRQVDGGDASPIEAPTVDGLPASALKAKSLPPPPPEATSARVSMPTEPPAEEAPPPAASAEAAAPSPEEAPTKRPRKEKAAPPPADETAPAPAVPMPAAPAPEVAALPPAADATAAPAADAPAEDRPKKKGKAAAAAAVPVAVPGADRPATMMVDDAIWAIYGGEKPAAAGASVNVKEDGGAPAAAEAPAKPAKAAKAAAAEEGGAPARPGVMVVQTSQWAGKLTYWALVIVLAGAAGTVGFAMASASSGRTVTESTEELRGIVFDLERGGLAALLSAQEATEAGLTATPQLAPVLLATQAEIEARLYADFGGSPDAKKVARTALDALGSSAPTVESLVARTALSTSAAELAALDRALDPILEEYPQSAKAWVLRARIAQRSQRSLDAIRALAQARAINPAHRESALELARWHVANGGPSSALALYRELVERQPTDVEALLERYVLHQITGADPDAAQAASSLAGLVREESPDVAKDEAGRVSLAFAVSALATGDLDASLGFLGAAESAFQESAVFKAAVGSVLLALGEFDRAKVQLDRAAKLDPAVSEHAVRAAMAEFGKSAGLVRGAAKPKGSGGRVSAPFGDVRLVVGRFELVEVEPKAGVFPLAAYRSAGGAREIAGAQAVALARVARGRGKPAEAVEVLEAARKNAATPELLGELGRAYAARGEKKAAIAVLREAIDEGGASPAAATARLALAELLVDKDDRAGAIDALSPLVGGAVVVPRAALMLGELRALRGDAKGALAAVEAAKTVDPDDPRVERALGSIQHQLDQSEVALGHFARALELQRSLGDPPAKTGEARRPLELYYLGRALSEKSEKKGTALLQAAVESGEAPSEARYYLGKLLIKKPKTKKQGVRELQKFRAEVPGGALSEDAARLAKGR